MRVSEGGIEAVPTVELTHEGSNTPFRETQSVFSLGGMFLIFRDSLRAFWIE